MKIIKRLDAQAIARQEKLAPRLVPNGEGEHATQVLDTAGAMFFVQVQDRFRVTVRAIDVAASFQLRAVVRVVIDLSVIGDVQRAVLVGHRLMTAGHIDDAQSAMAQTDGAVDEDALIVRATMRDDVSHARQHAGVNASPRSSR